MGRIDTSYLLFPDMGYLPGDKTTYVFMEGGAAHGPISIDAEILQSKIGFAEIAVLDRGRNAISRYRQMDLIARKRAR